MKRIIPIICLICACLCTALSILGLVMVCVATAVSQLAIVAIPCAIVGAVVSILSIGIDALFFKDKLCRAALFINISAFVISVVSIIIWFAVL